MQEYWVNVYKDVRGFPWSNKEKCLEACRNAIGDNKPLYRIHVKMKPKPIVKRNCVRFADKLDWMG